MRVQEDLDAKSDAEKITYFKT
jgi:hypothetical protein